MIAYGACADEPRSAARASAVASSTRTAAAFSGNSLSSVSSAPAAGCSTRRMKPNSSRGISAARAKAFQKLVGHLPPGHLGSHVHAVHVQHIVAVNLESPASNTEHQLTVLCSSNS